MPKDNETIHMPLDGPVGPSEPQGFLPAQMIRCDECLRANPPTRVNCLYCGSGLPTTEESAKLRKPILRQPEKHEIGFNSIFVSIKRDDAIEEAAGLLKLPAEKLQELVQTKQHLPLARTSSRDEAALLFERLQDLGIEVLTLSDKDLGMGPGAIVRPRSITFVDDLVVLNQPGGTASVEVRLSALRLIVAGRLVVRKVEVQERMSRKAETEILDTSQFFNDEPVFDLYSATHHQTWRIGANSFDFSCLEDQKTLVSGENVKKLNDLLAARATNICVDNSYAEIRGRLESVWPVDQETYSQGWRRQRPGKYSLGAVMVHSNESQFSRYSRLLRYFELNPQSN